MADAALAELASRFIKTDSLPGSRQSGSKMKVDLQRPATGLLTIIAKLEPDPAYRPRARGFSSRPTSSKARWSTMKANARPAISSSAPRAAAIHRWPTGCTILVFFMQPTAGLQEALQSAATASDVQLVDQPP